MLPAGSIQFVSMAGIAVAISTDLHAPVFSIRFRRSSSAFAVVSMPKASVYEDRLALADEGNVWLPWDLAAVQSIAVAHFRE